MSKYTQGVCRNGAAILEDGAALTVEEILERLNRLDKMEYETDHYMRTLELILRIANTAPRDEQIAYYAENVLRLNRKG
jgi:hypothetical protein